MVIIRKIFIYFQSGGFNEVFKYAIIKFKKIFYYKSETIFYYLSKSKYRNDIEKKSDINFISISNYNDLRKIEFERIKTLNHKEWFEKGSVAIIGYCCSSPVSFTWTHFYNYSIESEVKIELTDDKCWIGPSFVNNYMRGKKISQLQRHYQIRNAPAHVKYFLTSVNAQNVASIKSIERVGFEVGLILTKYYGIFTIFSNKKTKITYYNNSRSLFQLQL